MLNRNDVVAGAILVLIALIFGAHALRYNLGTFFQMGPGMFPLLVSGILGLLGVLILINGLSQEGTAISGFSPRSIALVLGAPIAFALTVKGLGLVAAAIITVTLGSFGSPNMTIRRAAISVVVLVSLAVAIFHFGLGLPIPMFGPWLTGV